MVGGVNYNTLDDDSDQWLLTSAELVDRKPSEVTVNRAARELADIAERQARTKKMADAEVQRVKAWAKDETDRLERRAVRTRAVLRMFMELAGVRTMPTPHGTARITPARKSVHLNTDVEDNIVAVLEATGLDHLVRTSKRVDKTAVKNHALGGMNFADANGEIHTIEISPQDLSIDDGEPRLSFKPQSDE